MFTSDDLFWDWRHKVAIDGPGSRGRYEFIVIYKFIAKPIHELWAYSHTYRINGQGSHRIQYGRIKKIIFVFKLGNMSQSELIRYVLESYITPETTDDIIEIYQDNGRVFSFFIGKLSEKCVFVFNEVTDFTILTSDATHKKDEKHLSDIREYVELIRNNLNRDQNGYIYFISTMRESSVYTYEPKKTNKGYIKRHDGYSIGIIAKESDPEIFESIRSSANGTLIRRQTPRILLEGISYTS